MRLAVRACTEAFSFPSKSAGRVPRFCFLAGSAYRIFQLNKDLHTCFRLRSPMVPSARTQAHVTVAEVAASIGAGLAKAALAGGLMARSSIPQLPDHAGQRAVDPHRRDPEGLDVIATPPHTCWRMRSRSCFRKHGHHRSVIGSGFITTSRTSAHSPLTDLAAIEKRMAELAARIEAGGARVLPRDEAVAYFKGLGEHLQGRDHRQRIPSNEDVSLACRAALRICAVARTCPARANSSTSS